MFDKRSNRQERIDTGDYTHAEYERFLREISFINRYLGDARALRKTLLSDIEANGIDQFSVLDVGSGSGELLRSIAAFARRTGRTAMLAGIDLNEISASVTRTSSKQFPEIASVRGDAFCLPFADGSFDYAVSSLFFHHLTDEQIPAVLSEMSRAAKRGIFVIDLHRHPAAYYLYKLFCLGFRISPLVTHDGSLSILRGFRPDEIQALAARSGILMPRLSRIFPFRLVLSDKAGPAGS